MNFARISKKTPHVDSRQTLNALHDQKLKEFEEERASLPDLVKKLTNLMTLYESDNYQGDIFKLYKDICDLQKVVQNIHFNENETNYLCKAAKYFKEYESETAITNAPISETETEPESELKEPVLSNFVNQTKVSRKGEICKNYTNECIYGHSSLSYDKFNMHKLMTCSQCDGMRSINSSMAVAVCQDCGDTITYQDQHTNPEYSDEIEILSPFAYKRINHFKEWVAQIQARESATPDQDVIDKLLLELKKDRIKDVCEITNKRIKGYLKKLRLNKYYEHIPAIIYKLSGISPPVITKKLEQKLITMFGEIQVPFEKHCPADRKNFMSYSYTLHKMCELLGEDELVECFDLLKSREKLYFQDKIWAGICADMQWDFIPSL